MDELGLNRYCCRRMVLTHVDLIEKLLRYATAALQAPTGPSNGVLTCCIGIRLPNERAYGV